MGPPLIGPRGWGPAGFGVVIVHGGHCRKIAFRPCDWRRGPPYLGQRKRSPEGRPMTTFDDRENAFENKYAHDEEMKFKAEARRNKLLGLWAAELLGKTGEDADAYAKEVVLSDFEEAGHEDVVRKVAGDLGDLADADTIRSKMDELLRIAKDQVVKETD